MDPPAHNTSLQRLQNVEKRIVRVLELAGGVMEELANPAGPRKEFVNNHCSEFMQFIKNQRNLTKEEEWRSKMEHHDQDLDIQVTLRDEIKSACEYRPFEKCDYSSRITNELCCKKLEYMVSKLDGMKQTIDDYQVKIEDS
uniref:Mediator of RNA polymerase II transcription subunit 11 n=1 Tax=Cucumis sativus TaxID=3659 RepID=A0A0A0L450_CUCSA